MAKKIRTEKWECKGKERFSTKEEALNLIFDINEESFGGYTHLRPYKCKYCKGYHLTSQF